MNIVITESVPEHVRAAVRERVAALFGLALSRHAHYSEFAAVVSLDAGRWNVTIVPIDPSIVWDTPSPFGVGPDLLEGLREALRLL